MRGMAEPSRPRRKKSSRLLRRRPQPLGRVERRGDDILIAGATAKIAGNRDPHLLFGRVRIVAQELDERRQDARRAAAALEAVVFMEGLLQGVQVVGRGRAVVVAEWALTSTVRISWPSTCTASIRQELAERSSKRMVHAPQTPCSQPRWVPVRPSW